MERWKPTSNITEEERKKEKKKKNILQKRAILLFERVPTWPI